MDALDSETTRIVEYCAARMEIVSYRLIRDASRELRDDLIGVGNLGIMSALPRFDENRGVQLATYLIDAGRYAMLEWLRYHGPAPIRGNERHYKVSFFSDLRRVDDEEWESGIPDERAGTEEIALRSILRKSALSLFTDACLTERQRVALALYYSDGLSFRAVAIQIGVSEARAYQLVNDALKKLRRRLDPSEFYEMTAT